MKKFEVGKKYYSRSICDHECIYEIEVISRTDKTITYMYDGEKRRSKIHISDNVEYIRPDNYSFAPTFRANKINEPEEAPANTEMKTMSKKELDYYEAGIKDANDARSITIPCKSKRFNELLKRDSKGVPVTTESLKESIKHLKAYSAGVAFEINRQTKLEF